MFGGDAPHLQKLAIRILSQTASSSGCERNWSVFERIHTKRRNRLEHQRLNDLVYVHYNLRLQNRYKFWNSFKLFLLFIDSIVFFFFNAFLTMVGIMIGLIMVRGPMILLIMIALTRQNFG